MKLVIKIGGALAVLFFLLALALVFSVDSVVRAAVQEGGTYALGTETKLESADVGLFSGSASISGLTIANPEGGFTKEHFLSLGQADLQANLASLQEDTVVIPLLAIRDVEISLERKEGETNYGKILASLERLSSEEASGESQAGGKGFVIERILIQNVRAHVALLPIGGSLTDVEVIVPAIELENVGTNEDGGVSMGHLLGQLVNAIMQAVISAGGDVIPGEMLSDMRGQLATIKDFGVDLVDEALEELGAGTLDAAKDLGKEISGLFGKGKDD